MSETYFVKQHRKDNFTILDNTCIRDIRLSWKSKGLHTYLMSLPEDWKICLSDLINRSLDGRDSVTSAIKELESLGYMQRDVKRTEKGCFKNFCYMVFESPRNSDAKKSESPVTDYPFTENPKTANPISDKPYSENPPLLTTNKLNTDKQKTELTNSALPQSESKQSVSESVFVKIIKGLFGGGYPFDRDFESAVLKQLSDAGIEDQNLEAYLKYVFERTKLGNVQKSFEGLYRKLALASSIVRDFKNSCFSKKAENPNTTEQKIRYIDCQICTTRFKEFDFNCPTCGVSLREINEQSQPDFIVRKKLYEMSESEKQAYESALSEITSQIKRRTGRPFLLESEKIHFWKEYGILN
ncbi:MAG: hypothetical protein IJ257_05690 [Treponema sp.]|nr:hypothetical protein [Treponema sp.]